MSAVFLSLLQLSFIQHSLLSPEVFCFADYPCHTVAIDILKAPPEDDNREIATWYANPIWYLHIIGSPVFKALINLSTCFFFFSF